jgi:hypothetical protein
VIPRHPELLPQLSFEFESLDTGTLRTSVAEQRGHDDLAMAQAQAASCLGIHSRTAATTPSQ